MARAATLLAETGLTFLFAPNHHPALRHAAQPRAELGFRTLLNLVGPAANPAGVRHQLVGVYAPALAHPHGRNAGRAGCGPRLGGARSRPSMCCTSSTSYCAHAQHLRFDPRYQPCARMGSSSNTMHILAPWSSYEAERSAVSALPLLLAIFSPA